MFVDAAAIVAILTNEQEGKRCSAAIAASGNGFTSAVAVWEAVLALTRANKLGCDIPTAQEYVETFLEQRAVQVRDLPPPADAVQLSLEAAHRFGSGRRRLNLADCFH